MSDARWFEIEADVKAATRHFSRATTISASRTLDGDDEEIYVARMAFMHAMQSGHTSMEKMLLRILDLLDEERPTGADWHADLIRRAAAPLASRPAILAPDLAAAALETRKFRHRAMHAYDDFNHLQAEPAARAAKTLADGLHGAVAAFRQAIDP